MRYAARIRSRKEEDAPIGCMAKHARAFAYSESRCGQRAHSPLLRLGGRAASGKSSFYRLGSRRSSWILQTCCAPGAGSRARVLPAGPQRQRPWHRRSLRSMGWRLLRRKRCGRHADTRRASALQGSPMERNLPEICHLDARTDGRQGLSEQPTSALSTGLACRM